MEMTGAARQFVLHAPNVHGGGGRALLLPLLQELRPPAVALLDTRLEPLPSMHPGVTVLRFPPTVAGRLRAESELRRLSEPQADILCFGNLPPLLAKAGPNTAVFLQNRYLFPGTGLGGLPPRTKVRLLVERLWLRLRLKGARLIVQSETMAAIAEAAFGTRADVCPFMAEAPIATTAATEEMVDYLYVASGEAHKNHATLLSAWKLLAEEGVVPSLGLTLTTEDRQRLAAHIGAAQAAGARIALLAPRPVTEMSALYASAGAAIYPSFFESFGLPLIEAEAAGLPVLAAERDYVRDLIDPAESFDPTSARSIARAVRRHLGRPALRPTVRDAGGFLDVARGRR